MTEREVVILINERRYSYLFFAHVETLTGCVGFCWIFGIVGMLVLHCA
jgi:hypothetical protein